LHGQVRNDDSHALFSIAAPDPDWWTDNINSEFVSSEVHQEYRIALASVSLEPPRTIGTDSISVAFQPTYQPSGFSQQSLGFNVPDYLDIDFEHKASQAYPDSASCMVAQNSHITSSIRLEFYAIIFDSAF
jgi:hypothetical protein